MGKTAGEPRQKFHEYKTSMDPESTQALLGCSASTQCSQHNPLAPPSLHSGFSISIKLKM